MKNEELRMKRACGRENISKLKQPLPEAQSRLFENQQPAICGEYRSRTGFSFLIWLIHPMLLYLQSPKWGISSAG
jgi:hypothetical protein